MPKKFLKMQLIKKGAYAIYEWPLVCYHRLPRHQEQEESTKKH